MMALFSVMWEMMTLNLDFNNGSSAQITRTEATSSVILRNGKGTTEYAD